MSTTLDRPRYGMSYGQQQQPQFDQLTTEAKHIASDILSRVDSRLEYHVWSELKRIEKDDPRANYVVDMVRSGNVPLHKFIPPEIQRQFASSDIVTTPGNGR